MAKTGTILLVDDSPDDVLLMPHGGRQKDLGLGRVRRAGRAADPVPAGRVGDGNRLHPPRNEFAHAHVPVSFSNSAIQALGLELHVPKALSYRLKARDQFLVTATMLALRLEYYRRDSRRPAPGNDPPVIPVDPAELEGAALVDLNEPDN